MQSNVFIGLIATRIEPVVAESVREKCRNDSEGCGSLTTEQPHQAPKQRCRQLFEKACLKVRNFAKFKFAHFSWRSWSQAMEEARKTETEQRSEAAATWTGYKIEAEICGWLTPADPVFWWKVRLQLHFCVSLRSQVLLDRRSSQLTEWSNLVWRTPTEIWASRWASNETKRCDDLGRDWVRCKGTVDFC